MTVQPLKTVNGKYGAPMGRANSGPVDPDFDGTVYVEPILDPCPNACGSYDYGGAYWGCGVMVYRGFYFQDGLNEFFFRADDPLKHIGEEMPDAEINLLERPLAGCRADDGEPCDWCHECEEYEL